MRNKNYSSGLKFSPRGTRVFISGGIGWAVFPIRLNCYPEIAVLELVPDKRGAQDRRETGIEEFRGQYLIPPGIPDFPGMIEPVPEEIEVISYHPLSRYKSEMDDAKYRDRMVSYRATG